MELQYHFNQSDDSLNLELDQYSHTATDIGFNIHIKPITILVSTFISNRYRYRFQNSYQTDTDIGFNIYIKPYQYRYRFQHSYQTDTDISV